MAYIKKKTNGPVYKRIEEYLLDLIRTQKLAAGHRLPPEMDIAKEFKTSQIPVRQAVQNLVAKEIVERQFSKGTFVKKPVTGPVTTNQFAILFWQQDHAFFASSFYSTILTGIQLEAVAARKTLRYRSFRETGEPRISETIRDLADQVDGIILVDIPARHLPAVINEIKTADKPALLLNYEGQVKDIDTIAVDSRTGAKEAVEFLIKAGHTRIACFYHVSRFDDNQPHPNFVNRINGYRDALSAQGIRVDDKLVQPLCFQGLETFQEWKENAYRVFPCIRPEDQKMLGELVGMADPPTAIFCTSDTVALNVYMMAENLGIPLPDKFSLMGFDNIKETLITRPTISTYCSPLVEMGVAGVQRLLQIIREKSKGVHSVQRTFLTGELVPRESHKNV